MLQYAQEILWVQFYRVLIKQQIVQVTSTKPGACQIVSSSKISRIQGVQAAKTSRTRVSIDFQVKSQWITSYPNGYFKLSQRIFHKKAFNTFVQDKRTNVLTRGHQNLSIQDTSQEKRQDTTIRSLQLLYYTRTLWRSIPIGFVVFYKQLCLDKLSHSLWHNGSEDNRYELQLTLRM